MAGFISLHEQATYTGAGAEAKNGTYVRAQLAPFQPAFVCWIDGHVTPDAIAEALDTIAVELRSGRMGQVHMTPVMLEGRPAAS